MVCSNREGLLRARGGRSPRPPGRSETYAAMAGARQENFGGASRSRRLDSQVTVPDNIGIDSLGLDDRIVWRSCHLMTFWYRDTITV